MALTAEVWMELSRKWCRDATARIGHQQGKLRLLSSAPVSGNPVWAAAPSWAATSLLATPEHTEPLTSTGRVLWALRLRDLFFAYQTPYRHTPTRQKDLLPLTLQYALRTPCSSSSSTSSSRGSEWSEDEVSSAAALTKSQQVALAQQSQLQHQAEQLLRGLAADMQTTAVRVFGWLLSKVFRYLFGSEVLCDEAGLERLRALQSSHTLVIVAAHKSHIDYLVMSYVMFCAGLPCPHIAAGANLSLPVVGRFLRACGAFFIRRSNNGKDADLYKRVLAGYMHALLREGQMLEWFIEGGRSRDGRINAPKLGLLSYVVDSQLAGDLPKPVLLVPASISFDRVLEERGLAQQLAGSPKKNESLSGLLMACWQVLRAALFDRSACRLGLGAGGICGRAAVAFGEPINLEDFLQDRSKHYLLSPGSGTRKEVVAQLGEAVTRQLCRTNVIMASVLLVGSLFLQQSHVTVLSVGTAGTLTTDMQWLAGELHLRGATTVNLPAEHASLHLRRLGNSLGGCVATNADADGSLALMLAVDTEARLRQHMRLNQLLPWLAPEGLITAALLACSRGSSNIPAAAPTAEVLRSALWLRRFLAPEMDAAIGAAALQTPEAFEPVVAAMQNRSQLSQCDQEPSSVQLSADWQGQRAALFSALLLSPLIVTYAAALQAVVAVLASSTSASSKSLVTAVQTALITGTQDGQHPLIVPSASLAQGALCSLQELGVLAQLQRHNDPVKQTTNGSHQASPSSSASQSSATSAYDPIASSVAAGLCQLAEQPLHQAATDLVVLGPSFRSPQSIQALLNRLRGYVLDVHTN